MIQENNVVTAELVMRDVAVSLSQMLKEMDGVWRTEFAQRMPQKIALESGREAVFRSLPGRLLRPGLPYRRRHSLSLHG